VTIQRRRGDTHVWRENCQNEKYHKKSTIIHQKIPQTKENKLISQSQTISIFGGPSKSSGWKSKSLISSIFIS
jgi:hypothetical protein